LQELPANKIRVSAFADNTKWVSHFSGGSRLIIEDPIIVPLQSKYQTNGVNIRYELRLQATSKVVVEVDNTYVHKW